MALAVLASACIPVASPLVIVSSASAASGAQKPVSAGFGDCKNDNSGVHDGYVCPTPDGGGNSVAF